MNVHLAIQPLLDRLPPNWQTATFKSLLEPVEERRGERDLELLSLSSQGYLRPRSETGDRQMPSQESLPRYLVVQPGDLVVNPMWLTGGSIAVSDISGAVSPDYRVFRPRRGDLAARYLHHVLRSAAYFAQYRLYTRADTTFDRRVQQPDLDRMPIPLPPINEQHQLAAYLDRQVGILDATTSLADSQVALSLEALRSRVAELLDRSDADLPLKFLCDRITSGPRGWGELAGSVGSPFLRIGNLPQQGTRLRTDDLLFVEAPPGPERERTRLQADDILISITASLGDVALVDDAFVGANVSQHVALVRLRNGAAHAPWIAWVLQSPRRRDALRSSGYGGTKVGLGLAEVGGIRVPIVPLERQIEEAEMLEAAWDRHAELVQQIRSREALLVEFKQTLITACVNGQLDISTASDRAAEAALTGVPR